MHGASAGPATVLLVQHYPDGGSITGLLDLVGGLDPDRYRPVVSFRSANPFVAELRAAGAEVVILGGPTAPGSNGEAGVVTPRPVARFGRRLAASTTRRELSRLLQRDLPAARSLLHVVRQHGVDIIHANNDVLSNRDAIIVGALTGRPIVAHVRWIHGYRRGATLVIDRALARVVGHFVFMSRAIAAGCEALAIPAGRATVLDDPFDPSDYAVDPSPSVRREIGLPEGAPVVVHVGRIVPWKGQDVFLRAMAQVVERHPSAVALVVGGGTDPVNVAFQRDLEDLVAELGIVDRVVFAGRRRDVPQVLSLSEVMVHCSTAPEPFGRVVVEGMAAGRAVVGAAAGGVPEIIDHGVTGLLVAPDDPDLLAEAIAGLLDAPDAAADMGRRARRAVQERFSLEGHARAIEAVYDRLLTTRRRRIWERRPRPS